MNKVYGTKDYYTLVRQDGSRTIVSFGLTPTDDNIHYTWYECYWYKKPHPIVTIEDVKDSIIAGVNEEAKNEIVEQFKWNDKSIWLSETNQLNYKTAYDLAIQTSGENLPYIIKVGDEDAQEYITFNTISEFNEFYLAMISHIQECQRSAWEKKNIDWSIYEEELNKLYNKED